jgi:predicted transcriptional regulator
VLEILQELPKLSTNNQELIRERLDALQVESFEETSEILAAIDAGIRSAETEPSWTVEQVRGEIASWLTKPL